MFLFEKTSGFWGLLANKQWSILDFYNVFRVNFTIIEANWTLLGFLIFNWGVKYSCYFIVRLRFSLYVENPTLALLSALLVLVQQLLELD